GAVAERIRFKPYCIFLVLWAALVYCPLAHWVWAMDWWDTTVELAKRGVQLALPVVVNADAPLLFAKWTPGDALAPDARGLPMKVPMPAPPHVMVHPEALLIPCVGFNRQRIRLGYGGGLYDRTLAAVPRPLAIGIAYSSALETFSAAPHDIALDAMVTEITEGIAHEHGFAKTPDPS
ncbi:MAG: 5-formyltetrahydrofolate cyclo-ligase, partial [Burkholderiales bacterium]